MSTPTSNSPEYNLEALANRCLGYIMAVTYGHLMTARSQTSDGNQKLEMRWNWTSCSATMQCWLCTNFIKHYFPSF